MSMEKIKCPHCGFGNGPYAVNANAQSGWHHTSCSKCHESYQWKNTNGKITTQK